MAQLIVLAVDTFQITGGQEDCPGAPGSRKGRLLAMVGQGVAYFDAIGQTAESQFASRPVDLAFPGTECAAFQD